MKSCIRSQASCRSKQKPYAFMSVGRIFSSEVPRGDFSKIFLGGTKGGEICLFPLETKKTTLFYEILKIQWGPKAPPALPTPMIALVDLNRKQ